MLIPTKRVTLVDIETTAAATKQHVCATILLWHTLYTPTHPPIAFLAICHFLARFFFSLASLTLQLWQLARQAYYIGL